jgi:hypothetical protein
MLGPYHLEDIVKRLIPVTDENSVTVREQGFRDGFRNALKEIVREKWSLRIPQNGWTDETLAVFLSQIENLINSDSAKIEIASWRDELTL